MIARATVAWLRDLADALERPAAVAATLRRGGAQVRQQADAATTPEALRAALESALALIDAAADRLDAGRAPLE